MPTRNLPNICDEGKRLLGRDPASPNLCCSSSVQIPNRARVRVSAHLGYMSVLLCRIAASLSRTIRFIEQPFQVLWMLVQVTVHLGKHIHVGVAKNPRLFSPPSPLS
jgi:hypothetical protein